MTNTPTPTDADRALAHSCIVAMGVIIYKCDILMLATKFAQARTEGAEAMREKAAKVVAILLGSNAVSEDGWLPVIELRTLPNAIRALPTGETK